MTVPCVPPAVTISRAARLAWRMRHPFRPGAHAAASVRPISATPASASPPASGCEGLVMPEGGRLLPALPGGKPAALAAAAAAAAGAGAAGAALSGAGGGAGAGGGGGSGPGFGGGFGVPNPGNPYTAVPFTGAPAGSSSAFAGPLGTPFTGPSTGAPASIAPGTVMPAGPISVADTAVPIPAPGATLLFAISAAVVITMRQAQRRRS